MRWEKVQPGSERTQVSLNQWDSLLSHSRFTETLYSSIVTESTLSKI